MTTSCTETPRSSGPEETIGSSESRWSHETEEFLGEYMEWLKIMA